MLFRALLLALAACGGLRAANLTAQVPLGRLSATPLLEIGAAEDRPTDQLHGVVAVRFLADGGLAVAERPAARVRIYARDGRHVRDLGGLGGGPGEMRVLLDVTVGGGDTVAILAASGARVRFTVAGGLVDHVTPEVPRLADERFNVVPWGVLPDGRILLRGNERLFGHPDGVHEQHFAVYVLDPASGAADTTGIFGAQTVQVSDGLPWPLAPPTPLLQAALQDGTVWLGSARDYRLRRVGATGVEHARAEAEVERVALTDADLAAMRRVLVARGATPNDRRVIGEWADGLPVAPHAPAFRSLFVDRLDRLWVQAWTRTAAGMARWTAHDAAGRPVLRVEAPADLELQDATANAVAGVFVDDLDRERVRVYGFEPAG